jgi:hypothetical protein
MTDLDEFLADDKFPAYDKMAKKFNRIMKIKGDIKPSKTTPADTKGDVLLDEFSDGPGPDEPGKKDTGKTGSDVADDTKSAPAADDDFNFEDDSAPAGDKAAEADEAAEAAKAAETETPPDETTTTKDAEAETGKKKEDEDFNFDDEDDFNFDDD